MAIEIPCNNCEHRTVCKHIEEFYKLNETVNGLMDNIKDVDMFVVKVGCEEFISKKLERR